MNAIGGARSAAHEAREPAAGSVAGAARNLPLACSRQAPARSWTRSATRRWCEIDGVWAKLEYLNPTGSIKARIAK